MAEIKPAQGTHTLAEIDQYLDMVPEHERTKYGGTYVSPDYKLYFFANPDDADVFATNDDTSLILAGPFPIGGGGGGSQDEFVDFRFTNLPSGSIYITGGNQYLFPLYVRSIYSLGGVEQPYDISVSLDMDVTLNGLTTTHSFGLIDANKLVRVDIAPYVSNGAAVRFRAYNDRGNSRTTPTYGVTRVNMNFSVQDGFWTNPFVQGEEYIIPLAISCNVKAQLKATLTDSDGYTRSSKVIPSQEFMTNYNLLMDHPAQNGGRDGIYTLQLELSTTDETLSGIAPYTEQYQVVCVKADNTTNYVIINNIGTNFENNTNNRMFDYCVVNRFGNPTLRIVTYEGPTTIADSGNMALEPGRVYSYILPLEMERNDDSDFTVQTDITLDGQTTSLQFTVSNKGGYAAVAGATHLIKMNGRSNSEEHREVFTNLVDGETIAAEWNDGMSWSENDGYRVEQLADGTSQTYLRLLAGAKVTLPISITNNCTIEVDFRVRNVLNYDTAVIEALRTVGDTFHGLKVTPDNIEIRTASAQKSDDQNVNFDSEMLQHMTVVFRTKPTSVNVNPDNYTGILVYIDGCKQRTFAFDGTLQTITTMTFGSDDADVDIFAIRRYDGALTNAEVEANTANWKQTEEERRRFVARNNVRENGVVDFNKVRSLCNVFVVETENDSLPDISWGKSDFVKANIDMLWHDTPAWDWTLEGIELYWQGTTSHGYLRQNFKAKAADKFDFDGGTHAKVKSLCFKKNFASSMQSHKIGSVLSYTDLAIKCRVLEEGERASIWQYPAVGFQKLKDGTYKFIGLYTIGPDKGDSNTFGFGDNTIALEGSDNEPLGTNFIIPWDSATTVTSDNESYVMCGVKAWEESMKHPALVEQYWKPAFNFVVGCSQAIALASSLAAMMDESLMYIMGGKTYYHNGAAWVASSVPVVPSGTAPSSLEAIKEARRTYFKAHVADFFDLQFAFFHWGFIEFHGASDNLSKNTYPYIKNCGAADNSGKIRWRQDDLDTIFDLENQGKAYKKYCVEIGDNYSMYGRPEQSVFNGTGNQFWLLMRLCFASEFYAFMRDTFIPALHYGGTADMLTMVMNHFSHYYFSNAQEYFPEALYNEDARYCYEEASLTSSVGGTSYGHQAIALSQCLGNHYSAEKFWVKMRYIYISSKYTADNFAMGTQNDTFRTRPYNPDNLGNTFAITPAIYMYPSVQEGNTKVTRGVRIFPGNPEKTWTVTLAASEYSDQEQRINGMSYVRSLGDMYADAFTGNITVNGKMLTILNLGTRTDVSHIRSLISGVTIGDAVALRSVDLSNLPTMGGVQDFSVCTSLRELYAEGTNVTSIPLCDGGLLHTLHLPATITSLQLSGKQKLTDLSIAGTANLTTIEVRNCNDYTIAQVLNILENIYG